MSIRSIPGWLALMLAVGVTMPTGAVSRGQERPNVIIFFTDDQGTLDANCYGSADLYTPGIDELARTGVRFTQAYAHTVCCPSRALLLTGRHPQRSGIVNWTQGNRKAATTARDTNLPLSEVTLAEVLRSEGYRTGLIGKWHLGAKAGQGPIEQGFDRFYGHLGGFIDNYRHYFLHGKGFHDLYEQNTEVFEKDEYFPDLTTRNAAGFIDANRDEPFFLYVAFNIPHYPEQPDAQFEKRYAKLDMPRRSYARMISTVDDRIGILLKKLDALDLRENTIVIFMSDNGHSAEDKGPIDIGDHASGFPKGHYYSAHGGGGNTGKWIGHKGQYFEGGIRVPAIVSYPALLPKGETRDQPVIAADWFPTVLELCGIEKPDIKLDGRSLVPLLRDSAIESPHQSLHWAWARGWAIREGDWKLIGNGETPTQLVSLAGEKPEQTNFLKEKPDLAADLLEKHRAWLAETSASAELAPFIGNWAFELPDGNPGWLQVSESAEGPAASLLWSVGSARPVRDLRLKKGILTFTRKLKWKPFGKEEDVRVIEDPMTAEIGGNGGLNLRFSQFSEKDKNSREALVIKGKRLPQMPPTPDLTRVEFGEPIPLFNGRDLTGWKLSNPKKKNGWRVENGELVNETPKTDFSAYGEFGNLMTERKFEDFRLTIEYKVGAGANSGIYLRGMYEAQVVDRDSKMQGIQGPGAIFGRVAPSENAGNPGGEWNRYVLTLVDRHITVELNGKVVIDNQPLEGCTGGGLSADDTAPGPIFLQGDHTSVRYRNIVIEPLER